MENQIFPQPSQAIQDFEKEYNFFPQQPLEGHIGGPGMMYAD